MDGNRPETEGDPPVEEIPVEDIEPLDLADIDEDAGAEEHDYSD